MKNKLLYLCTALFFSVMLVFTFFGTQLRGIFCEKADYVSLMDAMSEDMKYIGQTVPVECVQNGGFVILMESTGLEYYEAVYQPICEKDFVIDHTGKQRVTLQSYIDMNWNGFVLYGSSDIPDGAKVQLRKEMFQ